ncbi:hypothetical protein Taro_050652, partial [Colocasia esculenta]|nr:hypothetical protein [Colocasia esculenta]
YLPASKLEEKRGSSSPPSRTSSPPSESLLCVDDEGETKHLCDLHGAATRLHLFHIDILDYSSLLATIRGTAGVFHLASPYIVDRVRNPEGELLDLAVKGTVNVLRAAKECGVRRVVVTLSISAIIPSPGWLANIVKDEECAPRPPRSLPCNVLATTASSLRLGVAFSSTPCDGEVGCHHGAPTTALRPRQCTLKPADPVGHLRQRPQVPRPASSSCAHRPAFSPTCDWEATYPAPRPPPPIAHPAWSFTKTPLPNTAFPYVASCEGIPAKLANCVLDEASLVEVDRRLASHHVVQECQVVVLGIPQCHSHGWHHRPQPPLHHVPAWMERSISVVISSVVNVLPQVSSSSGRVYAPLWTIFHSSKFCAVRNTCIQFFQ